MYAGKSQMKCKPSPIERRETEWEKPHCALDGMDQVVWVRAKEESKCFGRCGGGGIQWAPGTDRHWFKLRRSNSDSEPHSPFYDALKRLVTAHFLSCPLLSFPLLCFEGPVITCWLQTCQSWQACWLEWVCAHSVCSCPREMPPFITNLLVRLPVWAPVWTCAPIPFSDYDCSSTARWCKGRKNKKKWSFCSYKICIWEWHWTITLALWGLFFNNASHSFTLVVHHKQETSCFTVLLLFTCCSRRKWQFWSFLLDNSVENDSQHTLYQRTD